MAGSAFSARVYLAPLPNAPETAVGVAAGLRGVPLARLVGARRGAGRWESASIQVLAG